MRVLIIGCKGFIGGHALAYFSAKEGVECWGADVITDYTAHHYFLIDSTNSDFNELFVQYNFDVCINCSGAASVPDSLQYTVRDFSLNTYNVIRLLDAIRKHNPDCFFINLSSAAVYGNPESLPITETAICKPVSPYGLHKLMAEQICQEYYAYFGVSTCSVRIFSAYGPGLQKQLLWDIYQKTKEGDTVNLYGTGEESRDFIYIDDILLALECIIEKGDRGGAVYNVASGKETTIRQLAEEILYRLGYEGELKFLGTTRLGDPVNWRADIGKIEQIGFQNKYSLADGIKKYAAWLKGLE